MNDKEYLEYEAYLASVSYWVQRVRWDQERWVKLITEQAAIKDESERRRHLIHSLTDLAEHDLQLLWDEWNRPSIFARLWSWLSRRFTGRRAAGTVI